MSLHPDHVAALQAILGAPTLTVDPDREGPNEHTFTTEALVLLLDRVRADERQSVQRADIKVLAATILAAGGLVRILPRHFADVPLLTVMQTMDPTDGAMVFTATRETRQ